ncbi:MAG: TIR domain-containing protein [Symploca sp. SIO2E6]|nr:TIR domain-containing protein [Symploca sp. SIO2E6]
MNSFQDGFISYGRADSKTFATYLHQRLSETGLNVWFDQNDIPLGVNFQNQIDDGIEKAHNFLFIIAPHSINSPYCGKEIELALQCHKRIIPLLHVEQINRKTWQQRFPHGTDEEWEAYKNKGLHSSFPNMHPEIGKINWVYFREGIDDFEKSFLGLLELFERHKTYVHQHTYFLTKALEWERHQKQYSYLLVGEERQQAEAWLKVRFNHEQPPCIATERHCEYITESIKNANNLMTQVFLSYSQTDKTTMEDLRRSLMQECFTVWTNTTDIQTSEDFEDAINRGIEQADNLIFLLSPDSLTSKYCQQELNYALSLNKRIIPVLVRETDPKQIPDTLRSLQYIDLTDNVKEEYYYQDESQLLKILRQDEEYHQQHKMLLVKALKWERQQGNPSILLRGYNLRYAQVWLKLAQQKALYSPSPLHEEFIAQSLRQPPVISLDAFMVYSSADADFARKLHDALQMQGKNTWFDQENLASSEDSKQEVDQGIESSDNILFVISPNCISSPECIRQVEYAQKLNKRIIGIVYQEVPAEALENRSTILRNRVSRDDDKEISAFPQKKPGFLTDALESGLASIPSIDFQQNQGDFFVNFAELIRTLDSDPDYTSAHTRLLVKAMEWEQEKHDDSFLLRGKDLVASEQWLQESADKQPKPNRLQLEYLTASRELPYRQIKRRSVVLTSAIVTVLVVVARFFGLIEPAELRVYDQLMRLRPSEEQDQRFLIVEVDAISSEALRQDLIEGRYEPGIGTIPDKALNQALARLSAHQPRLIGLDFYRDFKAQPELAEGFRETQNLIALCKASYKDEQGNIRQGYIPPREVPMQRIGFNDLSEDGELMIRRHLLLQAPDPDFCNTEEAFSLALARKYLEAQGHSYTSPLDDKGYYVRNIQLGKTAIPPLWGNGSPYRDLGDRLAGYQTLLNYRAYQGDPNKFAPTVSFQELLNGEVSAEDIQDRIIVIGYTDNADTSADLWNTPYGDMAGVIIQAQMASQIISAVLDQRPLIWWLPLVGEILWIFGWSTVGGLVIWWGTRSLRRSTASAAGILVSLYGVCYLILVSQGGWLPLVPPAIAVVVTGVGVGYLTYRLRQT